MDTAEALFEAFVKAIGPSALCPEIAREIKKNRALRKRIKELNRDNQ